MKPIAPTKRHCRYSGHSQIGGEIRFSQQIFKPEIPMIKVQTVLKKRSLSIVYVSSLLGTAAFAGDVDPRFEGRWVGSETFQFGYSGYSAGARNSASSASSNMGVATAGAVSRQTQSVPAILGIADHGKTLGITKGFGKGRYELVPEKSGGNTLAFRMPGTNSDKLIYVGRQHCTLTLSADGNTIKESGIAILSVSKGGEGVSSQVWGTFQRQGHY